MSKQTKKRSNKDIVRTKPTSVKGKNSIDAEWVLCFHARFYPSDRNGRPSTIFLEASSGKYLPNTRGRHIFVGPHVSLCWPSVNTQITNSIMPTLRSKSIMYVRIKQLTNPITSQLLYLFGTSTKDIFVICICLQTFIVLYTKLHTCMHAYPMSTKCIL